MNNEPVAWMDEINTFVLDEDYKQFPKSLQNGMIPLYTHPVKELTDEEILQFQDKVPYTLGSDLIDFARAILRKAQEK
jgi:hypothetical protein